MSYVFAVVLVCAAAFPVPAGMTAFKLLLCGLSGLALLKGAQAIRTHGYLFPAYFAYIALLVPFFISAGTFDYFSMRTAFNLLTVGIAAVAFQLFRLRREHYVVMIATAALMLALGFAQEFGKAKSQLHFQLLTFYVVMMVSRAIVGIRYVHVIALVLSVVLSIRAVTLACLARSFIRPSFNASTLVLLVTGLLAAIVVYYQNLSQLSSADSLLWRLGHWKVVLDDFWTHSPWFGSGIGASYRNFVYLLELEWYHFPAGSVDPHNMYLNVLYDTGIVGLCFYIAFYMYIYRHSTEACRDVLIVFAVVGLFQGGQWDFQLAMVFALGMPRAAVRHTRIRHTKLPTAEATVHTMDWAEHRSR